MGQTGSNMVKKMVSPWWGGKTSNPEIDISKFAVTPFVYTRRGSMYFDEDGDLAHEFYEETEDRKSRKIRMRKKRSDQLTPQGEVELPYPRLHAEFPVVLCDASLTFTR